MKTKMILLISLLIPFIGYSQDFQKIGIGISYHSTSIVGDSVRPFDLSLRYRINKHTVQIYTPIWLQKDKQLLRDNKPDYMKQEHYDMFNHTWSHNLWGIGVGYDYTFYSHSLFDFFTGISADFQWYEYREDYHNMNYKLIQGVVSRPVVYEDFYLEESQWYYSNKVKGVSIIPNTGIRFSTHKFTAEAKIKLYLSQFKKQAYYYCETEEPYSSSNWESYYPDKYRNEFSIRPDVSINLSYYF